MRFWAPGSPPQALAWRDSMPIVPDGGLAPSGRRGGAWWLENWIVDASETMVLNLCFAVDFESNSIF